MRIFISILISLTILFQAVSKTVIAFQFVMNQREIAEKRCENKNKPAMHCNGHCVLKKQMNADEKRQHNNAPLKEKYEVQYFSALSDAFLAAPAKRQDLFSAVPGSDLPGYLSAVFHPPLA